ncbi:Cold-active serine alkaline protease [Vibrio cholerae]|nr:Cold-active serine alkaline protease [Vibrio cholerae]
MKSKIVTATLALCCLSPSISSGSGDADLYVKTGQPPTQSLYDCRPYQSTNNETCVAPLVNEDLYIMLRAYRSFAGGHTHRD